MEADLTIVPVLNKIDLAIARPTKSSLKWSSRWASIREEVLKVSAKTGLGIDEVFQAIIERIPDPSNKVTRENDASAVSVDEPLKALVYNSHFDSYKGVVVYIRVKEGELRTGQKIKLMARLAGVCHPGSGPVPPDGDGRAALYSGQVGYFMAQIKNLRDVHIGDTVTDALQPTATPLAGYKEPKPMVFSGLYPINNNDFEDLREALGKLSLNDASFTLPARKQRGPGLWLPLRLPRHAPPRDHPAAPRTRQRAGTGADRSQRDLRNSQRKTGEIYRLSTIRKRLPDGGQIEEFREPIRPHQLPCCPARTSAI